MSYTYFVYDQIARDIDSDRRCAAVKNRRWSQALKLARQLAKK